MSEWCLHVKYDCALSFSVIIIIIVIFFFIKLTISDEVLIFRFADTDNTEIISQNDVSLVIIAQRFANEMSVFLSKICLFCYWLLTDKKTMLSASHIFWFIFSITKSAMCNAVHTFFKVYSNIYISKRSFRF